MLFHKIPYRRHTGLGFGNPRVKRKSSSRHRKLSWLIKILLGIFSILTFWLMGLIWFVQQVPKEISYDFSETDTVVVLTGGKSRLDTGLQLFFKGYSKQLFISGVALDGGDMKNLIKVAQRSPDKLACCINVGFSANTAENAFETATWINSGGFRSMRLVTATYHMPRSLLEMRYQMPDIKIIPHPVFPVLFKRKDWWLWPGTAKLLASEFNKYIFAKFRMLPSFAFQLGK